MGLFGIDVSEYQEKIDWSAIPSNYEFAIIRAGYGVSVSQIDKQFERNINEAHDKGFHIGAYWFLYALTPEEAIQNAEAFLSIINKHKGKIDLPVVLDVEGDTAAYMQRMGKEPSKYAISEMIRAFCKRMELEGYYVSVYSDNNFINTYFEKDILEKYDLWFAYWVSNFKPEYCIRSCGIWQYTSSGQINGIDGKVDLNYTEWDYPKIIKDAGLNHLQDKSNNTLLKYLVESGMVTETENEIIIVLKKKRG